MATTALGKEALPMPPGFESYSDAVGEGGTAYDWSTWKAQVEADAGAVANGYATGGEVAGRPRCMHPLVRRTDEDG
ncbi:unnamed protein product [Durusdinium trenchii]|uniref:Uncharacterized protein n=1 Tax=Durusdinium trenchii TaxID=1381693 RepID=A0ABP0HL00_9DINO